MKQYKAVLVEPTPEMLAATSWPNWAKTDCAHMLSAAPAIDGVMLTREEAEKVLNALEWAELAFKEGGRWHLAEKASEAIKLLGVSDEQR